MHRLIFSRFLPSSCSSSSSTLTIPSAFARRPPLCRRLLPARQLSSSVAVDILSPTQLPPIQLRHYQEECITAVLSHIDEGYRRMGISLATGSGKTVIFTQLIARLKHPTRPDHATRTLILVHRRELVKQAHEHCTNTYPDATIEIEMGEQHASGQADITIASVQSITSAERILKFNPSTFKLILIDEAHHAIASRYLSTLDHFGVLDMDSGDSDHKPIVVGVSATLSRTDGLALGKVLDYIVYHKDYADMIRDNWLSPVRFTTVRSNVDLSRVRSGSGGDFAIGELGRAVNTDPANEITVRSWLSEAQGRKSTIVFCVDIAHVHEITAKFRHYGVDARPVVSNTSSQDRNSRLNAFRRGDFPVLVNCGVFTEGTDIPNIDCVLLARPTKSRNLLVQMIGRGTRLYPGKEDCLVIDMVSSVEQGVITAPTLLGLDPDEILCGETMQEAVARVKEREEAQAVQAAATAAVAEPDPNAPLPTVTFTRYKDLFEMLADTNQDFYIRSRSQLSWVSITPSYHILSMRAGHMKICASATGPEGSFDLIETRALPKELANQRKKGGNLMRPRLLVEGIATLEDAVRAADTYAIAKYPRALMALSAPWRHKPASEAQMKILSKVNPDGSPLTMGRAGDMITRMKHGAIARFAEIENRRKREEKVLLKKQQKMQRLQVTVGAIPKGREEQDVSDEEMKKMIMTEIEKMQEEEEEEEEEEEKEKKKKAQKKRRKVKAINGPAEI